MLTLEESDKLIRELTAIDHDPLESLCEGGDGTIYRVPSQSWQREGGYDVPAPPAVTMVGIKRLTNVRDLLFKCLQDNILGDFIECGVWKGGACILASRILKGTGRKVYVCDSFSGVPAPKAQYPHDAGQRIHEQNHLRVSQEQVLENFKKFNATGKHVVFVPGLFQDTLKTLKGPFCVVRSDGDLYESTYSTLETLYPLLSDGGYLIEDDWILGMAQAATVDYRAHHGITAPIIDIDGIGVYWQKPRKPLVVAETVA